MASEPSADAAVEVSVVAATYDHEAFLEQALESVVSQQTDRPLEIIISEDHSNDGTRAIATAFADRDPRATLLLSPHNLRSNQVVRRAIECARGTYVCMLDGDDHWTSPTKVEDQASLLDAHPEVSAWFHNAEVVGSGGPPDRRWTPSTQAPLVTADTVWSGNPFATCAGMMRRSALVELGDWYDAFFPITDWPLYVLCAEHGHLAFTDEVVGAYRLHDGGLFSARPSKDKLEMIAGFYPRMDRALGFRHHDRARAGAARFFFDWAKVYADQGDRRMARWCLARTLRSGGVGRSVGRREWARCARRAR